MTLVSSSVNFFLNYCVLPSNYTLCDIAAAQLPSEIRKHQASLKEVIYQHYTVQENTQTHLNLFS